MTRARAIPDTITVHVPFRLVKRGGRKQMILPVDTHVRRKADDTLVKALARAFRWKRMLDSGEFSTIADPALGVDFRQRSRKAKRQTQAR